MIVKVTRDEKKIAMVKELGEVIEQRQTLEKREKELKDYFRKKLGKQDVVLLARDRRVVSKLCGRDILDDEALAVRLGDLAPFKKRSEYTEISVEPIQPEEDA